MTMIIIGDNNGRIDESNKNGNNAKIEKKINTSIAIFKMMDLCY